MPTKLHRLYVKSPLAAGAEIALEAEQAHYLGNVLRLKAGDPVLLFNGADGEWCASLTALGKKKAIATIENQTRPQERGPDLHYLFAPIKRGRLDYMAQKATEMGASLLQPVITRRTVAERVNTGRLLANAIEAAEQCGILNVPDVAEPLKLDRLLAEWDAERLLIFADEAAPAASPLETLRAEAPRPLAVLIGPEGGFEPEERARLLRQPHVLPISLGPRVMRADTAAVACLALVNAVLGDWR
ncbi:MAG: 16S rRNA (uracil(1498)-N(3))-methyltransferase [Methyloceanibacter sp.]|uniref:16S rRNA (uracil(1498)-N(3))-methyltransferase n=1 Tax=Methyloceanibacter sp. TaxID=1965321 RepID=UPI003D6CF25A